MSVWKLYTSVLVGTGLFLLLIWPTPYIIVKDRGVVSRVNRFTGIREIETDEGWRTRARIAEEQEAQEKEYVSEFEKASAQIQIQDEGEFGSISVKNPTEWSLGSEKIYAVKIDYYSQSENGSLTFLGNDEKSIIGGLPAKSQQRVELTFSTIFKVLRNLRSGTNVLQKVRFEFDRISSEGDNQTADLSEPFILKTERHFTWP